MKNFLKRLWQEEDGAETAEWVVIVALLVVVAIAIYNGILRTTLSGVVTNISTSISGIGT